jgi:hypothetical protein
MNPAALEIRNRVRAASSQAAFDNQAPPDDDEDDEIYSRRAAIEHAMQHLRMALTYLADGDLLGADRLMADAMSELA